MANEDEMLIDRFGLVVGRKEDQGDSCHRTCMYILGSWWFGPLKFGPGYVDVCIKYFTCSENKYCRHPSAGWWSDCDRFSRDQATPLIIVLGELGYSKKVWGFLLEHILRFGFFTNTRRNGATIKNHGTRKWPNDKNNMDVYDYSWKLPDFITLEFIGLYIRALDLWSLYPVLFLTDLEALIGSIIWRFKKRENDILNHMIICEYINRKFPTPIGWLAKRINSKSEFRIKLDHYFYRVGLPELGRLWKL